MDFRILRSRLFHMVALSYYLVMANYELKYNCERKSGYSEVTKRFIASEGVYFTFYLSLISVISTIIYFTWAVIDDAVHIMLFMHCGGKCQTYLEKGYSKSRNYVFTSFLAPLTMAVGILFWAFFLTRPDLVIPFKELLDQPEWMHHTVHTVPCFIVLLEQCFCHFQHTSLIIQCLITLAFNVIYITCLQVLSDQGHYIYPVTKYMDLEKDLAIGALGFILGMTVFMVCKFFSNKFWARIVKDDWDDIERLTVNTKKPPLSKHLLLHHAITWLFFPVLVCYMYFAFFPRLLIVYKVFFK